MFYFINKIKSLKINLTSQTINVAYKLLYKLLYMFSWCQIYLHKINHYIDTKITRLNTYCDKYLKDKGYLHFASHPKNKDFIKIKPFDLLSGKKITGSWGGGCFPDYDVKRFSKLTKSKYFKISKIINNEYSLDNINKAINDFVKGTVFRPIIKMQH